MEAVPHALILLYKMEMQLKKVNLTEKFSLFNNHWEPKIVGELNPTTQHNNIDID